MCPGRLLDKGNRYFVLRVHLQRFMGPIVVFSLTILIIIIMIIIISRFA